MTSFQNHERVFIPYSCSHHTDEAGKAHVKTRRQPQWALARQWWQRPGDKRTWVQTGVGFSVGIGPCDLVTLTSMQEFSSSLLSSCMNHLLSTITTKNRHCRTQQPRLIAKVEPQQSDSQVELNHCTWLPDHCPTCAETACVTCNVTCNL